MYCCLFTAAYVLLVVYCQCCTAGVVLPQVTLFDTDGIVVRFFNSPIEGNNIRSSTEVLPEGWYCLMDGTA